MLSPLSPSPSLSLSTRERNKNPMATSPLLSHFAPLPLLLLLLSLPCATHSLNVTALLAPHPTFSTFSRLLSSTSVAGDLIARSSLTLLAVPNSLLSSAAVGNLTADLADVIRYHVLLQYLSWLDLHRLPPSGLIVTTLLQTTGRAPYDNGAVNLTRSSNGAVTARSPGPYSSSNATILSLVASLPNNINIFAVDALMTPPGFDLAAAENRKPAAVSIPQALTDARDFNVAAAMMSASGVADEFESDERGAGITLFVPTDEAFANLAITDRKLQSMPAEMKAVVLRFHGLHSYYPLGSLESIVNPVQPTLATESTGAGRFTLNITRVNGSVAIDTGLVQAVITRTVFDQNPVAIFAVSRVLLPREMFGEVDAAAAMAPAIAGELAPARSEMPPARLSLSPAAAQDSKSAARARRWWCKGGAAAVVSCALVYVGLLV